MLANHKTISTPSGFFSSSLKPCLFSDMSLPKSAHVFDVITISISTGIFTLMHSLLWMDWRSNFMPNQIKLTFHTSHFWYCVSAQTCWLKNERQTHSSIQKPKLKEKYRTKWFCKHKNVSRDEKTNTARFPKRRRGLFFTAMGAAGAGKLCSLQIYCCEMHQKQKKRSTINNLSVFFGG